MQMWRFDIGRRNMYRSQLEARELLIQVWLEGDVEHHAL